jgi:hypothetical protein
MRWYLAFILATILAAVVLADWKYDPILGVVREADGVWGEIVGDFVTQADLNTALLAKVDDTGDTITLIYDATGASFTGETPLAFDVDGGAERLSFHIDSPLAADVTFHLPQTSGYVGVFNANPAGTYLVTRNSSGVLGYDSSLYLTTEADTLGTVTGRGAVAASKVQLQNVLAAEFGEDVTAGSANVEGKWKSFSAGDNAYSFDWETGTLTGDVTYKPITALPAYQKRVEIDAAGQMYAVDGDTVKSVGNIETEVTFEYDLGPYQTATLVGAIETVIIQDWPTGRAACMALALTNGGAFAITWTGVDYWPGGTLPSLTASGVDVIVFLWDGTNVTGNVSMTDVKAP